MPRVRSSRRFLNVASSPGPVRRGTARRASNRRATAHRRQGDSETRIIDFLLGHPGSTVGDLARALNVDPGGVSIRVAQLAKSGEISKATHGYSANQVADAHAHRRACRGSG